MTMQHLEQVLLNSGNPDDILRAQVVAKLLNERGEDIPLPAAAAEPSSEVAAAAGRHVLYDPANHMSEITDEVIEKRATNLENLHARIAEITDPISQNGIFNGYLPEPGTAPRKQFFAGNGDRTTTWGFKIPAKDGFSWVYDFNMKYKEVEGSQYRATEVEMTYCQSRYHNGDNKPSLTIGLHNGKPTFVRHKPTHEGFSATLIGGTHLYETHYSLTGTPSVTPYGSFDKYEGGGMSLGDYAYTFNPETNRFEVPQTAIDQGRVTRSRAFIDIDTFCNGLSSALALLPLEPEKV